MDLLAPLLSTALGSLGGDAVARTLGSACATLAKARLPAQTGDWKAPDALWQSCLQRSPRLGCYPVGAIAERAVKRTAARGAGARPAWTKDQVLRAFLSDFLFEMAMDALRQSRPDPTRNGAYWYQFSPAGTLRTAAELDRLRQDLAAQCEAAAARLEPGLSRCLSGKDPEERHQAIRALLQAEYPLPAAGDSGKERPRKPRRARPLTLHAESANIAFDFDALEAVAGRRLCSLVKDLLDLAVIVFMADQQTPREENLARRLSLTVPVSHLETWEKVKPEIARAVSFLGRDEVELELTRSRRRPDRKLAFGARSPGTTEECVALFSGGLDSLAGAAWLLDRDTPPILVSHYASTRLPAMQRSLVAGLQQAYGRTLRHASVYVTRSRAKWVRNRLPSAPDSAMAEHLRSFLFLALASSVAIELGISRVYMFENGPVALNPTFSEGRVNTYTAHPRFLSLFQALVRSAFGVELTVENPFQYLTKGEIVRILARPGLRGLIAQTTSCWNWFNVPLQARRRRLPSFDGRHDGECLPCILRRAGVDHAGAWDEDAEYLVNVFKGNGHLDSQVALADYLRYCSDVRSLPDETLLHRCPDFSVSLPGVVPVKLAEMFRRQAVEMDACVRRRASEPVRERLAPVLAGGAVPAT